MRTHPGIISPNEICKCWHNVYIQDYRYSVSGDIGLPM